MQPPAVVSLSFQLYKFLLHLFKWAKFRITNEFVFDKKSLKLNFIENRFISVSMKRKGNKNNNFEKNHYRPNQVFFLLLCWEGMDCRNESIKSSWCYKTYRSAPYRSIFPQPLWGLSRSTCLISQARASADQCNSTTFLNRNDQCERVWVTLCRKNLSPVICSKL